MTSTITELNTTLIFDLIRWAETDEAIEALRGQWYQGAWNRVDLNDLDASTRRALMEAINRPEHVKPDTEGGLCQTAYCMAGGAAVMADYRFVYELGEDDHVPNVVTAERCIKEEPTDQRDPSGRVIWRDVPGESPRDIGAVGQEVLGLTDSEADIFFAAENGLDELKAMVNLFCNDRRLPLMFPDHPIFDPDDLDDDDD